jgi:hypothetical protein
MLGSLARADPDTYIAAVRTLIVGFVLLFLVVGNVSAAVHGHTSAAGSEVLLHAGDAPGSDPGWPPACEICTHGLSSPADGPNADGTAVVAARHLAVPRNTGLWASWQDWPADRPPKSAIPD